MNRKGYMLLVFVLLVSASVMSQNKQKIALTLFDCIHIAADSSLQAFKTQHTYLSSFWEYRSYKASRLPSVNLQITPIQYNSNFTKRYDYNENIEIFRKQRTIASSGGVTITQNFDPTGGVFTVETGLSYMKNYGNNNYSQFSSIPFRLGYSQSLFGFNKFKWSKKTAPLKFEKAKKQYLYSKEEISEQVTQYFFNLAMALSEHQMAKENVCSTDSLLRAGKERNRISGISQSDLLTLELDLMNAKNTLDNAIITLKKANYSFISFLNLDKEIEVELILPTKINLFNISEDLALQQTKANNPDILLYKQEILDAEMNLDRAKKSSAFDASFSASIGFDQIGDSFTAAYRNPSRQDIVRIGLAIPILDWGVRKGEVNMAKSSLGITQLTMEQKELELEQDVLVLASEFNSYLSLILRTQQTLRMAVEAYHTVKQRFVIGKEDISSLTLSLSRRKEAQRNYISTLANYWVSFYKIRKITLYDFEKQENLNFYGEVP